MIALLIAYEAVIRFFHPVPIDYNQAIAIAALGLGVNVASVWLLGGDHHHGHDHYHDHDHHHADGLDHGLPGHALRDNNMRAAVVHVMADAAVSALVIGGLVLARLFGNLFWS